VAGRTRHFWSRSAAWHEPLRRCRSTTPLTNSHCVRTFPPPPPPRRSVHLHGDDDDPHSYDSYHPDSNDEPRDHSIASWGLCGRVVGDYDDSVVVVVVDDDVVVEKCETLLLLLWSLIPVPAPAVVPAVAPRTEQNTTMRKGVTNHDAGAPVVDNGMESVPRGPVTIICDRVTE
jgi:hypothetical protein